MRQLGVVFYIKTFYIINMKKLNNLKIYGFLIGIAIAIGLLVNIKCGVIFLGLFHLLLWINICVTNICNAIVAKENSGNDTFYKILCILIFSICFAIFM